MLTLSFVDSDATRTPLIRPTIADVAGVWSLTTASETLNWAGRVDTPAACAPLGMVNVSISPPLAIGERVGKAGPDPFRSPMMRSFMRDFRDAKVMAHALRDALKSQGFQIPPIADLWS